MAVKTWTGAGPSLSLQEVADEFGGTTPHSMSEYYAGGANVGGSTSGDFGNVPSSGAIRMQHFYGTANAFPMTVSADATNYVLSTEATAAGWDGTVGIALTINAGVTLYSTSTANAGLTIDVNDSTIVNNGNITGRGGSAAQAGGNAVDITATGVSIENSAGAFIAGGGGGGSGLGGGGAGQSAPGTASGNGGTTGCVGFPGGSTVNVYWSGCSVCGTVLAGTGGPQGGGGVTGTSYVGGCCSSPSYFHNPPGVSAGGRTQCGGGSVNNNPAQGGSVLDASSNVDGAGSNGGGGWGRPGEGGGGAAGAAISGAYVSYNDLGTTYGAA